MTDPVPPVIRVNVLDGWNGPPETQLIAAARAALDTARARCAGEAAGEGAELSVTFLTAESMRALNRDYHGVDDVTDVLTFGLGEDPLVGDIYISPET
uniref:rRNA maturation RNAse YbeY n=1 Tax=Candidatus Palauibacter sp. TaxID=3101350 RepID=UPI003B527648